MHLQRFFFFKQKTAYEILSGLVGSEMCIRDRHYLVQNFLHVTGNRDVSVRNECGNEKTIANQILHALFKSKNSIAVLLPS